MQYRYYACPAQGMEEAVVVMPNLSRERLFGGAENPGAPPLRPWADFAHCPGL